MCVFLYHAVVDITGGHLLPVVVSRDGSLNFYDDMSQLSSDSFSVEELLMPGKCFKVRNVRIACMGHS